jgi:hypothetical protein
MGFFRVFRVFRGSNLQLAQSSRVILKVACRQPIAKENPGRSSAQLHQRGLEFRGRLWENNVQRTRLISRSEMATLTATSKNLFWHSSLTPRYDFIRKLSSPRKTPKGDVHPRDFNAILSCVSFALLSIPQRSESVRAGKRISSS